MLDHHRAAAFRKFIPRLPLPPLLLLLMITLAKINCGKINRFKTMITGLLGGWLEEEEEGDLFLHIGLCIAEAYRLLNPQRCASDAGTEKLGGIFTLLLIIAHTRAHVHHINELLLLPVFSPLVGCIFTLFCV
uniref:Uncharacterized protein n=1 Tax=Anopheles darlingi TaxID=43151 RepID=A0A2M4DJP5_ANODA